MKTRRPKKPAAGCQEARDARDRETLARNPAARSARPRAERLESRCLLSSDLPVVEPADPGPHAAGVSSETRSLDEHEAARFAVAQATRDFVAAAVSSDGKRHLTGWFAEIDAVELPPAMPLGPFIEQRVILIGPGTSLVEIELRPALPRRDILEQIFVTDQSGSTIASSPLVEAASSLKLRLRPDLDYGRSSLPVPLVLKVALHNVGSASIPSSSPEAEVKQPESPSGRFTIVVRQQTSANTPEPPGRPASEPSDAPPPSKPPVVVSVTPGTNGSHGGSAHSVAPATNPSRSVLGPLVPTGPLPSQAASAVGGVFAVGAQTPIADPRDPTLVDLSLLELAPPDARDRAAGEGVARQEGDVRAGLDPEPTFDPSSTAVVAVRGPGGFPLFGSSLRTEPRSKISDPLPAIPTLIAEAPRAGQEPEVGPGAVVEGSSVPERRPTGRRLASRTAALVATFTAGAVLTSLPILPDVLATLQNRRSKAGLRRDPLRVWQNARPA